MWCPRDNMKAERVMSFSEYCRQQDEGSGFSIDCRIRDGKQRPLFVEFGVKESKVIGRQLVEEKVGSRK